MLSTADIQALYEIIQKQHYVFMGRTFGSEMLLPSELELLHKYNINTGNIYKLSNDKLLTSFQLGLLTQSVGLIEASKWTRAEFESYMKGNPLPLTTREQYILSNIKGQTLGDLRANQGRIFQDVNNILIDASRKGQEDFIKKEIIDGQLRRHSLRNIANEIASKTGDWSRNFDRIVEYNSNSAMQEGKAEWLVRLNEDEDPLVWKRVYESACKHCIKLYLTKGLGSEPIVFKLSVLRANGTNIGRKVDEWLPVVGSTHPFCRCSLNHKDPNYDWNPETQQFDKLIKKHVPIIKRKSKVRFQIGDRKYEV